MSEQTVRRVWGGGLKIQAQMPRMLGQGQAHVRDAFLMEELFRTVQQLLEGAAAPPERIAQRVEHLQTAVRPPAGTEGSAPATAPVPVPTAVSAGVATLASLSVFQKQILD